MKKYILIFSGLLIFISSNAYADDFMLPKSFSIETKQPTIAQEEVIAPPKTAKQEPQATNNQAVQMVTPAQIISKDISLTQLVKNYEYNYAKTLESTIRTLSQLDIETIFYDSSKGHIKAKFISGREIFIMILPSQEKLTHVRITPADGRYDFSVDQFEAIFKNIARNLYNDVN